MHGRNGLDKLTLTNYLKNSAAFIEVKDSVRFETNVSSAFIFKYKELGINLDRTVSKENKEVQTTVSDETLGASINDDLPF